jgi:chromosome segregation ATPase
LNDAIACASGLVVAEQAQTTDLATMLASMPELAELLSAERTAAAQKIAASSQRIAELEKERDNLRASHERLRQELELFKRRLFIAKAERVDNARQLELEFCREDARAGARTLLHHRRGVAPEAKWP